MAGARVRTHHLREMKKRGGKITALTAYDCPMARALDEAGIDIALVGDSVGTVLLGFDTTLPVTLEMMIHHASAVRRGIRRALLVVDMPFMSYQASIADALRSAGRLLKEAGAEAVKLEGGREIVPVVKALRRAGIAVMGHIGLTPQSVHALGGNRIQGRKRKDAAGLLASARALEKAGAFAIVLESIPARLAARITKSLSIPTIGIGAGKQCDGQVLVSHDLLGACPERVPMHAKIYADEYKDMVRAFRRYASDVRQGVFPGKAQIPA